MVFPAAILPLDSPCRSSPSHSRSGRTVTSTPDGREDFARSAFSSPLSLVPLSRWDFSFESNVIKKRLSVGIVVKDQISVSSFCTPIFGTNTMATMHTLGSRAARVGGGRGDTPHRDDEESLDRHRDGARAGGRESRWDDGESVRTRRPTDQRAEGDT